MLLRLRWNKEGVEWRGEGVPGLPHWKVHFIDQRFVITRSEREGVELAGWLGGGARGASCDPQQELGRPDVNVYALSNHSGCFVFLLLFKMGVSHVCFPKLFSFFNY